MTLHRAACPIFGLGVLLLCGLFSAAEVRPDAIAVDRHAQLLLDDRLIDQSSHLKRTVHQPEVYPDNPLIKCEKPWEGSCVTLWGTVLFDEQDQLFKMWYQSWRNVPPPTVSSYVCYATSKDGIKWEKPDLGLIEFDGDRHTNIVLAPQRPWLDSPTVVKDLSDPDPSRRYKMCFCENGPDEPPAIWHAVSEDGIRWRRLDGPVVKAGDRNSLFYDEGRKKWVVITRVPGIAERTVGFAEGDEFGKYGPMRLVFRRDEKDPPDSDLYSMPTFLYEGLRIGCVEVYDHPTGREITQLAWSHDGEHWTRDSERQPFMRWGEPPAWDWARRHPHNGPPIVRDGKLWIYFGGRSTLKQSKDPRRIVGAIGLSFLRVDGFCSRDAGETEGSLLSKPLTFTGSDLVVNADVKRDGAMSVEVLDAAGNVIEGFDRAACQVVSGDRLDHAIRWRDRTSLRDLAGREIRLRFQLRNADLYSFRFR